MEYHEIGFSNMPPGCLAFKQMIMDDKDVVREWLDLAIEPVEDKEYMKISDMFAEFSAANRSFQSDKKTKKTAKAFEKELHRCMSSAVC